MDVIVGGEFKSKLERLDVKLTELSGFIPSSLIKRDVRLIKETSEKGGAFSDVYEGQAGDGTKIAIKKLRTSLNGIISDSRAKQTKVSATSLAPCVLLTRCSGILSRGFDLEELEAPERAAIAGGQLRALP